MPPPSLVLVQNEGHNPCHNLSRGVYDEHPAYPVLALQEYMVSDIDDYDMQNHKHTHSSTLAALA